METERNEVAIRCLNAAIDESGIPRKVLAGEAGLSEPQFSKLVRSTAIDLFDSLPDRVLLLFLERMGKQRAFEVRQLRAEELDQELLVLLDQVAVKLKLRQVRTRPAKAELAATPARRAAL